MTTPALPKRAVAEFLGTALLVATVIGSGIMGERSPVETPPWP